jgi:hypothetical protein
MTFRPVVNSGTTISRRTGIGLLLGALTGIPAIASGATFRNPEFRLYFSPNSAALSAEAITVIRDAKVYRDGLRSDPAAPNVWCYVIGGVDGLEFAQGKQHLALDRAAAVGRALEGLGLAPAEYFPTRRKDHQPFVPGQVNVAEAYNRAVAIELYAGMAPIAG